MRDENSQEEACWRTPMLLIDCVSLPFQQEGVAEGERERERERDASRRTNTISKFSEHKSVSTLVQTIKGGFITEPFAAETPVSISSAMQLKFEKETSRIVTRYYAQ